MVVFSRDGGRISRFELSDGDRLEGWVLDAERGAEYAISGKKVKASGEGVVAVEWPGGRSVLTR
jgi:hypothetical protein